MNGDLVFNTLCISGYFLTNFCLFLGKMIEQEGESDAKVRWYSIVTTGQSSQAKLIKPFSRGSAPLLGVRYESVAAASDSSNPASERYEYQAEVSIT